MHRVAVMLMVGALASSGCGVTTRAQAPIERPVLDVPPAPPRIIEPAPPPAVVHAIEPVSDLPPPPAEAKPIRRSPREIARDTQKPEPKPETLPPVEPPAAAPPPAVQPAPQLRTPATADAAAAEQRTRDTLSRAQGMLDNVNYQRLSPERRKSYDDAKEFIKSSEGLIKTLNFELANEMAEKAEKLARALQGG